MLKIIGTLLTILLILAISLLLYFLPSIIAIKVKHPNKLLIFVINLLTGWSVIGWIICLILVMVNGKDK